MGRGGLDNYGSVLRDCATVIAANPRSSKAYYRAGLALLALERADEALDVCARAGEAGADDAGFKTLRGRAEKKREELRRKDGDRRERARQSTEGRRRLNIAIAVPYLPLLFPLLVAHTLILDRPRTVVLLGGHRQERNLINVPNPEGKQNPYAPKFDPEDATGKTLIMPVFFLYPEHGTSDAVPEFVEDSTIGAHLAVMFPSGARPQPWDVEGKYADNGSLVVYATTRQRRLLKVGRKMTLLDLYRAASNGGVVGPDGKGDGLEMMDWCLSLVVVPKGEVERKWVEEYKSTRELWAR